jgi:squalene-hopene/tetraprenyl-beta-curcumene cyclase
MKIVNIINHCKKKILDGQKKDGHWVYEIEADTTIPSEYILMNHFLGIKEENLEKKFATYIKKEQNSDGGWPLFWNGESNISTSVKAYYALKLVGEKKSSKCMVKARKKILDLGGAKNCNVFTKISLALFGQISWKKIPSMPVEIMLLPTWFPFHINKISYWSRTVVVPLLIILDKKPNLFFYFYLFFLIYKILKIIEPFFPKKLKKNSIEKAKNFIINRSNKIHGLGAIFPAMTNCTLAFYLLGLRKEYKVSLSSVRNLITHKKNFSYCQPCFSPVWDTGLNGLSLLESGLTLKDNAIQKACKWLEKKQILGMKGDWIVNNKNLLPGGWAFQYENDFYPDVDDTAVVAMFLDRAGYQNKKRLERACNWIIGMQSKNGGWGSFDKNNTYYYLNNIPFADHGALLDPPTADVSARCVSMLSQINKKSYKNTIQKGVRFLKNEQEEDGSWFGRWGANYIYGTWSVLHALKAAGEDMNADYIKKSIIWIKNKQNKDGGWGEDCATYWKEKKNMKSIKSMPSQTSWAILSLLITEKINELSIEKGVKFLKKNFDKKNLWIDHHFNAVGFPKVFYITYHGYAKYFTNWALSRYQNLKKGNKTNKILGL